MGDPFKSGVLENAVLSHSLEDFKIGKNIYLTLKNSSSDTVRVRESREEMQAS